MPNTTHYIAEIDFRLSGIPCIIGVTYYNKTKGSYSYDAPSDWDYYGYTECDWEVLDRKGYKAPWLERKLTDNIRSDIDEKIANYFS